MTSRNDMSWDERRELLLDVQAGDTVLSADNIIQIAKKADNIFIYAEAAIALTKCNDIHLHQIEDFLYSNIEEPSLQRAIYALILYTTGKNSANLENIFQIFNCEKSFILRSMILGKLSVISENRDLPIVKEFILHALEHEPGRIMANNLKDFLEIIDYRLTNKAT